MNWSRDRHGQGNRSGPTRRGYHHGNLREALIKAALDLISVKGTAGFTFAEAARSAGVSPAAPYRHFRDRDALMADIARQGFERFESVLSDAWSGGAPDPFTALCKVGKAYLAFARAEPAYYSAMFEAAIPLEDYPELRQAGDRAFAIVRDASSELCETLPKTGRPPALMVALHIWALAHGIASLFARGDAGRRKLPMTPEDLLEAAVLIYLQGLGWGRSPS